MHYVYLLKSLKNGSLYTGCTSNLKKRITEHNTGASLYTSRFIPWKLIYLLGFASKDDAYLRERALKMHKQGIRRLKERITNSLCVGYVGDELRWAEVGGVVLNHEYFQES